MPAWRQMNSYILYSLSNQRLTHNTYFTKTTCYHCENGSFLGSTTSSIPTNKPRNTVLQETKLQSTLLDPVYQVLASSTSCLQSLCYPLQQLSSIRSPCLGLLYPVCTHNSSSIPGSTLFVPSLYQPSLCTSLVFIYIDPYTVILQARRPCLDPVYGGQSFCSWIYAIEWCLTGQKWASSHQISQLLCPLRGLVPQSPALTGQIAPYRPIYYQQHLQIAANMGKS